MRPVQPELLCFEARTPAEALRLAGILACHCAESWRAEAVLGELLMNAVEHGNLEFGAQAKRDALARGRFDAALAARLDDPRYAGRKVSVEARRLARLWRIDIRDAGPGFDFERWRAAPEPPRSGAGGRGLLLVTRLLGALPEFREGGAHVRVHLPASVSESEAPVPGADA